MSRRVYWDIVTEANGTLRASALREAIPRYERGEAHTFEFGFETTADYEQAREFLDYATANSTFGSLTGVPRYRERLPSSAPVDSNVLALEPNPDVAATFPGVWGLLVDGEDTTLSTGDGEALAFEVFVLAERSEYADHAAVSNALETT